MTGASTEAAPSPDARMLARQTRELAAFAERRGLDDELAALRAALASLDRHRREAEGEGEAVA